MTMSKIKLPRRRKKAFIKKYGSGDYFLHRITGEILMESGRYKQQFIVEDDKGNLIKW